MALLSHIPHSACEHASALNHSAMQIREAQIEDAVEACQILRRSIVELCRADHQDDPGALEKWLNNKTPDNVRSWIAHPDSYVFVATEDTTIVGVGAVTSGGEITLNYVSPDARFQGVSKALLINLRRKLWSSATVCVPSLAPRRLDDFIYLPVTGNKARLPPVAAQVQVIGWRGSSPLPRERVSASNNVRPRQE